MSELLEDSDQMTSCGIEDGCTVHATQRVRGGGVHKNKKLNRQSKQSRDQQLQEQASENVCERQQESQAPQLSGYAENGEQEAASKDKEVVTLVSTLILKWREQEATVNVCPPNFTRT